MKNVGEPDRPQKMIYIQHMHCACWITKATDTHSKYVIHIAFPRPKWLHKRASMLCYMCFACLIVIEIDTAMSCGLSLKKHLNIEPIIEHSISR